MEIKFANKSHIPEITDIFNYYIENSFARFETEPLSYENRASWFEQFDERTNYHIYVAIEDDNIIGFSCSQQYRPIKAFENTVEVTIYLKEGVKGKGVGSALYSHLLTVLAEHGVHRALSGIALPNDASVNLHKRFGFQEVGVFNEYAMKDGQYISSIWLEKRFKQANL